MTKGEKIAASNKAKDPQYYANKGREGGRVSGIKKGFGAVSQSVLKRIQESALKARMRGERKVYAIEVVPGTVLGVYSRDAARAIKTILKTQGYNPRIYRTIYDGEYIVEKREVY